MNAQLALHQARAKAREWQVSIAEIRETPTSVVAFGKRGNQGVVLKVCKVADERHAGEVLRAFAGDGVVRVYEFQPGSVLLERLEPAEQLVEIVKRGDDDRATEILAGVMRLMARHSPSAHCRTVFDWARGFDRYLLSGNGQIPANLIQEAHELFLSLARSQQTTMLLHGDLHHYNVLFDSNRGWVAIDPKGVVGELEYEVGAILRNPVEQPELFSAPSTIQRRLEILCNRLELDYDRAIRWTFAQSVLSAIWDFEDGYAIRTARSTLEFAATLRLLLP